MQAFKRLSNNPLSVYRLLQDQALTFRSISLLPSLATLRNPSEASSSLWQENLVPRPLIKAEPDCPRCFSSSTVSWRKGYGQSETEDSLRRRGTVQEEESASVDEDELDQMDPIPHGVGEPNMHFTSPADQQADPLQAEEQAAPQLDLDAAKEQKAFVDQILTGQLDPFSESSIPKSEMDAWLRGFRMKVIDVNRINRGSRTGGIGRFSALAVVGNSDRALTASLMALSDLRHIATQGVLGLGMGKALSISDAIMKAHNEAVRTLFFVPRYRATTLLHPVVATYGKCKVTMYPRSTGSGCKASTMITSVCQLAGIRDIGVKVHGTRNVRNTVKALIRGFESQEVQQEMLDLPASPTTSSRRASSQLKGAPTTVAIGLAA